MDYGSFSRYGKAQGMSPSPSQGQEESAGALENMLFERQMQAKELENMAQGLMSQDPAIQQKIQMELKKRYRLNPAQKAAMQMFAPSDTARSA